MSTQERTRARIILLAAQGKCDQEIAKELGISTEAVERLLARFARRRVAAVDNPDVPIFPREQADFSPRTAVPITLLGSEKRALKQILNAGKSEQRMAQRAKVILRAALGIDNTAIAEEVGWHVQTVRKWRARFLEDRMEGLYDLPRAGRPSKFDAVQRAAAINVLLGPPPEERSRWTLDLAVEAIVARNLVEAISAETLSRWLRTAEIKPHRVKYWLNCKDPDFNAKMERVVALYRKKPAGVRVLCLDEKTCIQAKERCHKDQSSKQGCRLEFEYKRHGTVNLLAAYDPHTGEVVAECVDKNDSATFLQFLCKVRKRYRNEKLLFILDNGTTHRSKETTKFLRRHPWLGTPVFLPVHASWLNQVEVWFSVLSRQALRHASFASRDDLITRILRYVEVHNKGCKPYRWTTHGEALRI